MTLSTYRMESRSPVCISTPDLVEVRGSLVTRRSTDPTGVVRRLWSAGTTTAWAIRTLSAMSRKVESVSSFLSFAAARPSSSDTTQIDDRTEDG